MNLPEIPEIMQLERELNLTSGVLKIIIYNKNFRRKKHELSKISPQPAPHS
jgi:hypothetical protein